MTIFIPNRPEFNMENSRMEINKRESSVNHLVSKNSSIHKAEDMSFYRNNKVKGTNMNYQNYLRNVGLKKVRYLK